MLEYLIVGKTESSMNKNKTLLDVIGPIMIGPSSSHTAGACRIGLMAGRIFGNSVKNVDFILYNSFAKTGFGHGTQLALLSGVMGLDPDNSLIRNAFKIAQDKGINYSFSYKEDLNVHPNGVDIKFFHEGKEISVSGASLGAGEFSINKINGYKFDLRGDYITLVLIYKDTPGVVYRVANLIQNQNVNIASMHCDRNAKGQVASMGIALDNEVSEYTMQKLSEINDMYFIRKLEKIA